MKKTVRSILQTKHGRIIMVLFLAATVVTASASVYVSFYTSGTATVRAPDVKLVAGSDISGSCASYPCATGSIASTGDLFTVTLSWFPATTGTYTPATYYDNFTTIRSSAGSHTIQSVSVVGVGGTTADFGSISVYYCGTTHTTFSALGVGCANSCAFTGAGGCSIATGLPNAIGTGASNKQYIEIAAYAASAASAGTSVTFQIAVQWT